MNTNDLAALENKLKEDLSAIKRVRELLANGSVPDEREKRGTTTPTPPAPVAPQGVVFKKKPAEEAGFGEVLKAVSTVVATLKPGFTIGGVSNALVLKGESHVFSSIRGAIRRLEKQGKIRIIKKGKGRSPTFYAPHDATEEFIRSL